MTGGAATTGRDAARGWALAGLVLAVLAVAGSLALTWVLGLKPCPLCFYQRAFAMGLLAVFGVGLLAQVRGATLCAMALPLAVGGLGVAVFHVYLELAGKLVCPDGLLGLGTAPKQSLTIYVPLVIVSAGGALAGKAGGKVVGAAAVLGLAFAYAGNTANGAPPAPKPLPLGPDGTPALTQCLPAPPP